MGFLLLGENRYAAVTSLVSATTRALPLPVGASQNPDRRHVWRSTVNAAEDAIDVDFQSVQPVSFAAAANIKLKTGGGLILQHRGDGLTPGTAVDVVTLPAEDAGTRVAVAIFAAQSHRHWRWRFTNPGAVADFAELGYAGLGVPFAPQVNISLPVEWRFVDPSVRTPSIDGQVTATQRTGFRAGSFRWEALAEVDRDKLVETIYRAVGTHLPVFVRITDAPAWQSVLVWLGEEVSTPFSEAIGRYDVEIPWEEVR